jgi:hypothetical protein
MDLSDLGSMSSAAERASDRIRDGVVLVGRCSFDVVETDWVPL